MRGVLYCAAGWISLTLGIIGMFLPVMPTTCFVLLAAYCFSKGSPRLDSWIHTHPTFGPMVLDWEKHRAIRPRAKRMATAMISCSLIVLCFATAAPLFVKIGVSVILAGVVGFIWRCPDGAPKASCSQSPAVATDCNH